MRAPTAFAVIMTVAGASAFAAEPAYRLDKVAETGTTYTALGVPAVNDAGVVAFAASTSPGIPPATPPTNGVFFGVPGALQQVATPGQVRPDLRPVDINNAGQIAFVARDSAWGVYRSTPGGTLNVAGSGGNTTFGFSGGPSIDDLGRVAYITNDNPAGPVGELLITTEGDTGFSWAGPLSAMHGAHRNNDGLSLAVSPYFVFFGSAADRRDIVRGFSDNYTDPETGATGPFNLSREADAGDGGRAVFGALHGGARSLFLWDNGTISKVPGSAGIGSDTDVPAINDLGQVAALLSGRLSVFDAAGEHRVVSVGDAFDGSTVSALAFNAEGWNDLGQRAFTATLADGRGVNVLATVVPEPGAAGALLACAGAATLRRRRAGRR